MGLFDLFRKRKNRHRNGARFARSTRVKLKEAIEKVRNHIDQLQTQTRTMGEALDQQSQELSDHRRLIEEHSLRLSSLEQVISWRPPNLGPNGTDQASRSDQASGPGPIAVVISQPSSQKLDVNCFSEQEKKILAIFFQNQGMALSYIDVARALSKSPHTIKNQIRQMRLKADLFDRTVGDESRNRFRLKEGLRIEKYLNVGYQRDVPEPFAG
jgi:hypothetical protein